jgi:GDP-L-fucose synthase
MDLMVMEAARLEGAERFLVVSSSCVYPVDAPVPTPETAGFDGDPEPANYGYGWAKRLAEKKASMYEREFGLKAAIVRPYNGYGPRAVFDSETGHVVSALIKRIFDGDNPVVVWGDGNQRRTFLHASDFARGLILAVENYAECDPVNIGSDEEITIRELAELTVLLSGRDVELVFDDSKPSGMPRRHCDTTKAKQKIGFRAEVTLQDGLKDTIDWYRRTFSR